MKKRVKKERLHFFRVSYEVECESAQRLYKLLKEEKIPASNVREKDGKVKLEVPFYTARNFERLCADIGYQADRLAQGDMVTAAKRLLHRPGLIIGLLLIAAILIYLKNIVMRFDIISQDEKIRKDIMNVLKQENITVGTYIPDIDLVVVERALKQRVEGISWAGITRKGNSLIIDVVENIPAVKSSQSRLPSNLVATENAVINKVRVVDGQLCKAVGSGVCKGEVIVSGIVEKKKTKWTDGRENVETSVRYARSSGVVEGTFERKVVFEQKLNDIVKRKTGDVYEQKYLHLYSADIPLFFKEKSGNYYCSQELDSLSLAGRKLPVGIKTLKLEEYDFKPIRYTEDEAYRLALKKCDKYEVNFLGQYEIKKKTVRRSTAKGTVRAEVTYTLYGNICEEAAFFIKKDKNIVENE